MIDDGGGVGDEVMVSVDLATIIPGGDITQEFIQVVAVYDKDNVLGGGTDDISLYVNGASFTNNTATSPVGNPDWSNNDPAGLGFANGGLAINDGAGDFEGEIAIFRFLPFSLVVPTVIAASLCALPQPTGGKVLMTVPLHGWRKPTSTPGPGIRTQTTPRSP